MLLDISPGEKKARFFSLALLKKKGKEKNIEQKSKPQHTIKKLNVDRKQLSKEKPF